MSWPLAGNATSALVVRRDAGTDRRQLALTDRDSADATVTGSTATSFFPNSTDRGDYLAVVYDAAFGGVRFYVNGQWDGSAVKWTDDWDLSTTGLQVGRDGTGAAGSEYFAGAVEEVRVFDGALGSQSVAQPAGWPSGSDVGGAVA